MRRPLSALIFVTMMPAILQAGDPVLPRGLGFRIAGQPETAAQMRDDLRYVDDGVDEAPFEDALKRKLHARLADAVKELDAATGLADAARARERLDRDAAALMSAQQTRLLRERTLLAFAELFVLINGFSAHDVNDEFIKALGLTPAQTKRIRDVLDQLNARPPDGGAKETVESSLIAFKTARKELRAVLTPEQRKAHDKGIAAAIKAATAQDGGSKLN